MNALRPHERPVLRLASAWLPVLAWAALVWGLGGDGFSHPETSRLLGPLLDWLWPDLDPTQKQAILGSLRKLAHPVEYGVLALLADRAVASTLALASSAARLVCLALAAALAVADETRQAASTARTGSGLDVALDVAGALLVLIALHALERRRGRRLWRPAGPRRAATGL